MSKQIEHESEIRSAASFKGTVQVNNQTIPSSFEENLKEDLAEMKMANESIRKTKMR